ncbi:dynein light chain roadblock-type 2 [Exaiptasia diaphana]|uniref:Roadblock/LAMTOR2 domain-containing protein n=1 Tax=Exaiptasia diaphana TaxID=2652724 RepID=A0A913Y7P0_EXADI|nr:dynein light chain roadblock-type 2 [Exaiptasia diaphana]
MDRFNDKSDQQAVAGVQDNFFTQEVKIHLKDDGLGKYKIENDNFAEKLENSRYASTAGKRFQNSFTSKKTEVEETLKRIQAHKGVVGVLIMNSEGIPIRTTLDNATSVQYAGLFQQLANKARTTVRDIDPQNELTFLRIRSKKHEIMVAPDREYYLIVIQNPNVNQ